MRERLGLARVILAIDAWRTLQEIEIPALRHSEHRRLNRLTNAYGGSLDLSVLQIARIVARATEYTFLGCLRLLRE